MMKRRFPLASPHVGHQAHNTLSRPAISAQPATSIPLSRLTQALHLTYRYSLMVGMGTAMLGQTAYAETTSPMSSSDSVIQSEPQAASIEHESTLGTETSLTSSDEVTDGGLNVTTQKGRTPIDSPTITQQSARSRPNFTPSASQTASLERLKTYYQTNTQPTPSSSEHQSSDSTITPDTDKSTTLPSTAMTPAVDKPATTQPPAPMCRGTWVYPTSSFHADEAQAAANTEQPNSSFPLYAESDYGYYDSENYAELSGNVQLNQGRQQIAADKVVVNLKDGVAAAQGNVLLVDTGQQSSATRNAAVKNIKSVKGGLITVADELAYQTDSSKATAKDVAFASVPLQAHGYAKQLNKIDESHYEVDDAMFTTCDPERPVWQINAKSIDINTDTGRGKAYNATLKIKNTPVLYLPYFNFPIDDRRTSGFLLPRASFSSDGGLNVQVPYYFNLAPNYDATLTPSVFTNRNPMLTGEFRYLTQAYGEGNLTASYLPNDKRYYDEDRSSVFFQHRWRSKDIPTLSAEAVYQYVSDSSYFSDFDVLDSLDTLGNQLNLPRRLQVNYYNDYLTALGKFETFQTLDGNLTDDQIIQDKDKPYYRLPQISVHYKVPWIDKLDITGISDFAYFKRPINDGSAPEQSGGRLYNKLTTAYPITRPWGYLTPAISLQHLYTQFDQKSQIDNHLNQDNKNKSIFVPEYSLDAGLNFYKAGSPFGTTQDGGYQLISPRLKYVYSPYKYQNDVPNFNTRLASLNFPQLYENSWFLGYDRLPDNNHLTPSVNYRFIDGRGLTRLDASIGQRIYFEDLRVRLTNTDEPIHSGRTATVLQLSSQPRQDFWVDLDGAINNGGSLNYYNAQFRYQPNDQSLYNLGLIKRNENILGQRDLSAITASAIFPFRDNWRFLGAVQFDTEHSRFSDALAGISYESCCYGISVYGRSYYNELDNAQKPTRAIMAEISLNGLSNRREGRLSSLIGDRVLGYNRLQSF